MLSVRVRKGRTHPFVCVLCQVYLWSIPSQSHQPAWPARCFSTTPQSSKPNDNRHAPTQEGLPGLLSRASPSSFGSFASAKSDSPAGSGLLPHEVEARKRVAGDGLKNVKNHAADIQDFLKRDLDAGHHRHSGGSRNGHEAHVKKSNSILADIFKTTRKPSSPSPDFRTRSRDARNAKRSNNPQGLTPDPTKTSSSSKPSAGQVHPDKPEAARAIFAQHPPGGAPRQVGWGAFSQRKVQTTAGNQDQSHGGNEATVGSEITRSRGRSRTKSHHKPKGPAGEPAQATSADTTYRAASPAQDFWGELETRVADLSEGKEKRGAQSISTGARDEAESRLDSHSNFKDGDNHSQRRKSRFEIEEESTARDRGSKKTKKSSKGRRAEYDRSWSDESVHRWEQHERRKGEKEARRKDEPREKQPAISIFLPEYISASNLAQALKQLPEQFLSDMEEMGFENVTPDTIMTGETAALISMEYGFEPTVDNGSHRDLKPRPDPEGLSSLPSRPPIVTIMGHVDHGKTTLLDWLRKSSVAAQEHGGITQHIGAFVVKMSSGKQMTFLDTPGHAAFLSMRQRGANVTDIVVLVVAADDSVMPQTVEALKHATTAQVPIIVAINKIDKEDARVDQVKADLARHGVEIEDFGGDVQVVCVSGKTGQGMTDLEENIITLSEVLDVRAEIDGMAEGWILESSVKQNGKVATVLVKRGTLRPGDVIVAGKTWARIRSLRNEAGTELTEALPGDPVQILGWRDLPSAGERVLQAPDESRAKTAVEYRQEMAEREESSAQLAAQEQRQRAKAAAEAAAEESTSSTASDGDRPSTDEPGILYQNFTVRADVVGSVEAVCGSILELGNNKARPKILRSAAGQISEYDVDHAAASNSIIVNFNLPVLPHIKQRAEEAKVRILNHSVIYHVVDDARAALVELLPMNLSTRVSGEADILQVFPINVKKRVVRNIAGCRVRNGSIKKSALVRVLRKGKIVFDGKIDTLRHVKKDVSEMGKGTECGIGLEDFDDFQVDDQIQTYEEVREKQTL